MEHRPFLCSELAIWEGSPVYKRDQQCPAHERRTPPALEPDFTSLLRTLGKIAREQAKKPAPTRSRP